MAEPIRPPDERPGDAAASAAALLGRAVRLAVGLGALPLLGLMAAARGRSGPARPAPGGEPPPPARASELPPRAAVEAALDTLADATLPKGAPRGRARR